MSRRSDQLARVAADIEPAQQGIDVALSRADQWSQSGSWLLNEEKGGSGGDSFDRRELREQRLVVARATRAVSEIPRLLGVLEDAARRLRGEIAWLTATSDPSSLPDQELACESCRREGEMGKSKIGGHFSPIWKDRSKKYCRWCAEYREATQQLPPLEAVELYHSQSPRAAGLWLARLGERKAS